MVRLMLVGEGGQVFFVKDLRFVTVLCLEGQIFGNGWTLAISHGF